MLKIGDFSKLTFVSVKTLRYYDELGLLKPVRVDRESGYRYYTIDQLPRLNRILALKDLGLSLGQIAVLLRDELTAEHIRGILRLKLAETKERIREEEERRQRVEVRLKQIEMEGMLPMTEVIIKDLPEQYMACIRRTIPNYGVIGELFTELFGAIMPAGVRPLGPTMAIYHDLEFKEEQCDVEVCIPVGRDLPGEGQPIRTRKLPGGKMACTIHTGPYENIGEAYSAVMSWLEANGYRLAGPQREVYLRGPGDTRNPQEYVTEIQAPVEKA